VQLERDALWLMLYPFCIIKNVPEGSSLFVLFYFVGLEGNWLLIDCFFATEGLEVRIVELFLLKLELMLQRTKGSLFIFTNIMKKMLVNGLPILGLDYFIDILSFLL
jgi:hypothetical protein